MLTSYSGILTIVGQFTYIFVHLPRLGEVFFLKLLNPNAMCEFFFVLFDCCDDSNLNFFYYISDI